MQRVMLKSLKNKKGFTLIELIMTITLLALGVGLTYLMKGAGENTVSTYNIKSAAERLQGHLRYAQSQAIKAGDTYGVQLDKQDPLTGDYISYSIRKKSSTTGTTVLKDSNQQTMAYNLTKDFSNSNLQISCSESAGAWFDQDGIITGTKASSVEFKLIDTDSGSIAKVYINTSSGAINIKSSKAPSTSTTTSTSSTSTTITPPTITISP